MTKSARRMAKLTHQLLAYARRLATRRKPFGYESKGRQYFELKYGTAAAGSITKWPIKILVLLCQ